MNANELADAMQGVISVLNVHHEEDCLFIANDAQYMLRQQQEKLNKYELRNIAQCDRIAILEAQVYGGTTK